MRTRTTLNQAADWSKLSSLLIVLNIGTLVGCVHTNESASDPKASAAAGSEGSESDSGEDDLDARPQGPICEDYDVYIKSKEDIHYYENCEVIRGRLAITDTELRDLDGLNIVSVEEDVWITGNSELENIDGLLALESIGDSLLISNNGALTDVDGLQGLRSVGLKSKFGGLEFESNPSLESIDGISGLTDLNGSIVVDGNAVLVGIPQLDALSDARSRGRLVVKRNDAIMTLNAAWTARARIGVSVYENQNLISVLDAFQDDVRIYDNPKLTSISLAFSEKEGSSYGSICGDLKISDNDQLESITGMSGCESFWAVDISENRNLSEISGLPTLRSTSSLVLMDNPRLSDIESLTNIQEVNHYLIVWGNAFCNSMAHDLFDGLTNDSAIGSNRGC